MENFNSILSDGSEENKNILKKIKIFYPNLSFEVFILSQEENLFFSKKKEKKTLEEISFFSKNIINIISFEKKKLEILKKIENLKLEKINNKLSTRISFLRKKNFKNIFKNNEMKTPVFEEIFDREPEDLFSNFIQPSRIFSKENNYFSEKIVSVNEIRSIFKEKKDKIKRYFIEEFIEGEDIFSFIYKKNGEIFFDSLIKKENKYFILDEDEKNEIKKISQNFFENNIDKFSLMHFKKNKKRGIFFLNIWVDIKIILIDDGKIMEEFFERNDKIKKDFFDL